MPQLKWKDCGKKAYPVHVSDIVLKPRKIRLPGDITLGFTAELDVTLAAPLKVQSSTLSYLYTFVLFAVVIFIFAIFCNRF